MNVVTKATTRTDAPTYTVDVSAEALSQWILKGIWSENVAPGGHYPEAQIDFLPGGGARVRLWKTEASELTADPSISVD